MIGAPMAERRAEARAIAAGYDQAAARYDELHGRDKYRRRAERLEAPLRRVSGRVLELGCGTGRLLARVPGQRFGLDLSRGMLQHAQGRGITGVVADAVAPPFTTASFDAIIAGKGVFRYLEAEPALAACARLLRPGGLLGVHQYAARTWSLRGGRPNGSSHLHLDRPDQLAAPAAAAGFRLLRVLPWRSIAAPPYIVGLPPRLPGRWWSQVVLLFRRGSSL